MLSWKKYGDIEKNRGKVHSDADKLNKLQNKYQCFKLSGVEG